MPPSRMHDVSARDAEIETPQLVTVRARLSFHGVLADARQHVAGLSVGERDAELRVGLAHRPRTGVLAEHHAVLAADLDRDRTPGN